jgi:hypothetical protein
MRHESRMVRVPAGFEQNVLEVMEPFGWNLHNQQEVVAGVYQSHPLDGMDDLKSVFGSMFNAKTKAAVHHVNMHFTRPLDLPHLPELRTLEQRFRSLPDPPLRPRVWPLVVLYLFYIVPGVLYHVLYYNKKKASVMQAESAHAAGRRHILQQALALGSQRVIVQ